jgi:hypothetical protein
MNNILFGYRIPFLLITLFVLASCSSTKFTSNGKIPVKFEADEDHQKEVVIKGDKKFYLWGLVPEQHTVYVDEVIDQAGFEEASGVFIQETREPLNTLIGILSFGLYIPKSYSISIFTLED